MTTYKLDIKNVLKALDKKDMSYYSKLSDEEKKGFNAWVTMRFLSSAKRYPDFYLLMVNDFVNVDFNLIHKKHPELMWKSMCMCGLGSSQFHPWIPPPKKKKEKLFNAMQELFPSYKAAEIEMMLEMHSKEDIKDELELRGYDDKEIEEILK